MVSIVINIVRLKYSMDVLVLKNVKILKLEFKVYEIDNFIVIYHIALHVNLNLKLQR